jgi:hypothetical protein
MFLGHVALIESYSALVKLVFSDHLRLQYPSLQVRLVGPNRLVLASLAAVIDRAESDGEVSRSLA